LGALQISSHINSNLLDTTTASKLGSHRAYYSDEQGDVYEELLSELNLAGKNGQFRTPAISSARWSLWPTPTLGSASATRLLAPAASSSLPTNGC